MINKPWIKEVYEIYYLPHRIRIGTGLDYAIEIDDPEEKYAPLIKKLDGTHNLTEIVAALKGTLNEQEVHESIQLLLEEGYLEDADVAPPALFSPQELERYRVNLRYFSTLCKGVESKYDYQATLKNTHVLLLGLGGIGSNVCMALAELGIGRITAVDFDRVELQNLNRQVLYGTSSVSQLKTEVATRRMGDFNPDISFHAINQRIQSLEDARAMIDANPCDLVILVADRPTGYIDYWVNQACVERETPLFAAGVNKQIGVAYSVIPGETACFNCRVLDELESTPQLAQEIEFVREHALWAPNGALGPPCMFQAYMLSYEILRYLFKTAPLLTSNCTFVINFMTFEQEYRRFEMNDKCPVCSPLKKTTAQRQSGA